MLNTRVGGVNVGVGYLDHTVGYQYRKIHKTLPRVDI